MRLATALATLAVALASSACRDEQAGPKPRSASLPSPKLLDSAPEDLTFTSGATWAGGAVRYLGTRVAQPRPGQPPVVAHYFRAEAPPPAGYQFFVHVIDPATGQMLANADHEIQGGAAPLARWPVGKVIEDVHPVPVPKGVGQVQLLLGFWAADARLPVDDPKAQDGLQRMLGPVLSLGVAPPLPEYHARRAPKPPQIDGSLADAVWNEATPVQLAGSFDGRKPTLTTTARLLYDDQSLYVAFDVEDPDVWGTLRERDDPIYTQEAVEVFLDANGDGKTYDEIEVSPNNTLFDAYFPARRMDMDLSWDSGVRSAAKVNGTLNDPSDRDQGWTVEMQIPIQRLAEVPNVPPRSGDRWRFNLYRLEMHGREPTKGEGMAFSPLYVGDFHNLLRFGWLVFD